MSKSGVHKAAKRLHYETGNTFEICLQAVIESKADAEIMKTRDPLRPFTECLLEAAIQRLEEMPLEST